MPKKKKQPVDLDLNVKETESLRKSVAHDLKMPDRILTMEELANWDYEKGEVVEKEQDGYHFSFAKPTQQQLDEKFRKDEQNFINRIDNEMDTP